MEKVVSFKTIALIVLISLNGCVNIDYVGPISGPKATITVRSETGLLGNIPILYHTNKCDYESSKLVGLLTATVIGVENVDHITFDVPANQVASLSIQALFNDNIVPNLDTPRGDSILVHNSSNMLYCRPVVDMFVEDGREYRLELVSNKEGCSYEVDVKKNDSWLKVRDAEIRKECVLPFSRLAKPN